MSVTVTVTVTVTAITSCTWRGRHCTPSVSPADLLGLRQVAGLSPPPLKKVVNRIVPLCSLLLKETRNGRYVYTSPQGLWTHYLSSLCFPSKLIIACLSLACLHWAPTGLICNHLRPTLHAHLSLWSVVALPCLPTDTSVLLCFFFSVLIKAHSFFED